MRMTMTAFGVIAIGVMIKTEPNDPLCKDED